MNFGAVGRGRGTTEPNWFSAEIGALCYISGHATR